MLSGKGFQTVYNISGGIKAYNGNIAIGDETLGLYLFTGKESLEDTLLVAYSLEQGLREFYQVMEKDTNDTRVKKLFHTLADIEIIHQDHVLKQYRETTGADISSEDFEKLVEKGVLEGGMTTQEYLALFNPDVKSTADVISMAMSIEAQALDLYERAARTSGNQSTKDMLYQISKEEKHHMEHLGRLMDSL